MARSVAEIVTIVNELVDYLNNDVYLGAMGSSTTQVCFDCTLWNDGYQDPLATPPINIPPLKTTISGILDQIIVFLEEQLVNPAITDYGFKTQLQRFLDIIKDLKSKIAAIQCEGPCPDVTLLAQLLTTLVMTVTELITTLELLNGLFAYLGICGCMGSKFFELMMGKFINSLSVLLCTVQDWSALVMTFFQFQAIPAKSYIAAYVPKQPLPVPPPQGVGFACVPCPPKPQPINIQQCGVPTNCVPFNPYGCY